MDEQPERLNSARTAFTGKNTVANTNITQGSSKVDLSFSKDFHSALEKLSNKNSKLAEYIKFDSALSRDQAIDIGRISTLGDVESMNI